MNFRFIQSIIISLLINSCFSLDCLSLTINFTHDAGTAGAAVTLSSHWKEMIGIYEIFYSFTAYAHDIWSLFWSKQVTCTKSGMVSTPHILMRQGVNYVRLCEIMQRNQKICELANMCEAPFYARHTSSHAKNYALKPLKKSEAFSPLLNSSKGSKHNFTLTI